MVLTSFVMSCDQGIGPSLPHSPEPTGNVTNSPTPGAEGNETHRFGLLLRRRWSSSAGTRRVWAAAAVDETHRFGQRWRSRRAQRVYSLKLYNALRRSRRNPSAGVVGVRVRDTANRVLAAAARGTTRWSRAILVSRLGTSGGAKAAARGAGRRRVGRRNTAEDRVRVLARLVPGCRRTALPELLNETADYIAALEMQVRAMTALAEILAQSQPSDRLGSARLGR